MSKNINPGADPEPGIEVSLKRFFLYSYRPAVLSLHRRLLPVAGRGDEFDRLQRPQARLALPAGHLLEGPGAGLAGEGEVEAEQGADLAGLSRGILAVELLDHEDPAGTQRLRDPLRQGAVGRVVDVVDEVGDEAHV